MDIFWKALGAVLVSAVVNLCLERQSRDFSLLLTLAVSSMVLLCSLRLLEPVISFLGRLEELGNLSSDLLLCLVKIFGMGMAGEIAASVCQDGGNASLGKGLHFLTNAAILYLSVPVFTALTELFLQILGEL